MIITIIGSGSYFDDDIIMKNGYDLEVNLQIPSHELWPSNFYSFGKDAEDSNKIHP